MTDPVSDLFARIKNAVMRRQRELTVPYSKFKAAIVRVLVQEGYLKDSKKESDNLVLRLAFKRRQPVISNLRVVSRPGLRVYRSVDKLPSPLMGAGISIISTSRGVMSNKEARKKSLGGEVIGEVW